MLFRRIHDPRTHTHKRGSVQVVVKSQARPPRKARPTRHKAQHPQQDLSRVLVHVLPFPIRSPLISLSPGHTRPRPKTAEAVMVSPEHAPGCRRSTRTGSLWAITAISARAIDARPCSLANAIRVSPRCSQPATGHTRSQRGTTHTQTARFVNHDGSRLTAVDDYHMREGVADCACRTLRPICDLWSSNPCICSSYHTTCHRPRASAALPKL